LFVFSATQIKNDDNTTFGSIQLSCTTFAANIPIKLKYASFNFQCGWDTHNTAIRMSVSGAAILLAIIGFIAIAKSKTLLLYAVLLLSLGIAFGFIYSLVIDAKAVGDVNKSMCQGGNNCDQVPFIITCCLDGGGFVIWVILFIVVVKFRKSVSSPKKGPESAPMIKQEKKRKERKKEPI